MSIARPAMRIAAAVLATGVLALTACEAGSGGGGTEDNAAPIRMAIQPWLGYGPWYIAQDEGYFEDAGVDVEIVNFGNDADMAAALGSGQVDVANVASHTALQLIESGLDMSIVLALDASHEADAIIADGSVSSVEDLAGKEIAFEEGSVSNLLLNDALSSVGLSLDDITPVPMAPSDAANALVTGRVPVAVTYEPYISEAATHGDFSTVYTAAENAGLISDVLIVSNDIIDDKAGQLQSIVNAWGPAIDCYDADEEAGQTVIATNIGSSRDDLITAFEGVHFYPLGENTSFLAGEYTSDILPLVSEASVQAGIIDGTVDLGSIVDTRFVEAAE